MGFSVNPLLEGSIYETAQQPHVWCSQRVSGISTLNEGPLWKSIQKIVCFVVSSFLYLPASFLYLLAKKGQEIAEPYYLTDSFCHNVKCAVLRADVTFLREEIFLPRLSKGFEVDRTHIDQTRSIPLPTPKPETKCEELLHFWDGLNLTDPKKTKFHNPKEIYSEGMSLEGARRGLRNIIESTSGRLDSKSKRIQQYLLLLVEAIKDTEKEGRVDDGLIFSIGISLIISSQYCPDRWLGALRSEYYYVSKNETSLSCRENILTQLQAHRNVIFLSVLKYLVSNGENIHEQNGYGRVMNEILKLDYLEGAEDQFIGNPTYLEQLDFLRAFYKRYSSMSIARAVGAMYKGKSDEIGNLLDWMQDNIPEEVFTFAAIDAKKQEHKQEYERHKPEWVRLLSEVEREIDSLPEEQKRVLNKQIRGEDLERAEEILLIRIPNLRRLRVKSFDLKDKIRTQNIDDEEAREQVKAEFLAKMTTTYVSGHDGAGQAEHRMELTHLGTCYVLFKMGIFK